MKTRVKLPDETVERFRGSIKSLKRDIQLEMIIDDYPLLKKLEENPSPADWATFASYLRMIHTSGGVIHPEIRRRIETHTKRFLDLINERLARSVSGYWITVEDGDTYLNCYNEEGLLERIKLGYVDVMNILGAKNVNRVVEIIVKRSRGIFED